MELFQILSPNNFLYQAIGIVAFIIGAISFQFKSNKVFLLFQCVSCGLFGVQFLLVGEWAGFLLNCVCVARCLIFAFVENKKARRIFTIFICLAFLAAGIISSVIFGTLFYMAIVVTTASIVGAISISTDNEKIIRYVQIGFVSPCWLFHNIWYTSIGGIISECLNIVSAAIALIRWKKEEKVAQ